MMEREQSDEWWCVLKAGMQRPLVLQALYEEVLTIPGVGVV